MFHSLESNTQILMLIIIVDKKFRKLFRKIDPNLSTSTQHEADDSQIALSTDNTGDLDDEDDSISELEARKSTLLSMLPLGSATDIKHFEKLLETDDECESRDIAFVSTIFNIHKGIVNDSR